MFMALQVLSLRESEHILSECHAQQRICKAQTHVRVCLGSSTALPVWHVWHMLAMFDNLSEQLDKHPCRTYMCVHVVHVTWWYSPNVVRRCGPRYDAAKAKTVQVGAHLKDMFDCWLGGVGLVPLLVLWHGFMDFRQRMTSQSSRLVADLAPANCAKRGEFKRHFESFWIISFISSFFSDFFRRICAWHGIACLLPGWHGEGKWIHMARTIEQLEELKHGERAEPSQHKAQSITKHPKSTPSDAISCGMRQALFHLVSHLGPLSDLYMPCHTCPACPFAFAAKEGSFDTQKYTAIQGRLQIDEYRNIMICNVHIYIHI